jgi:plastocyanin
MTKREKIIVIIAITFLVLIVVIGIYFKLWRAPQPVEQPINKLPDSASKELIENKYTQEVPKAAQPTKPTETIVLENGNGNQQGIFAITASASGYAPSSVTVKKGDIVTFQFTASGADYDMFSPTMGFHVTAKKGETKEIGFKTTVSGTFLFECRDFCPVTGKIQGTIVVLP